jgi:NADH-quinone oxidoreductase subunit L
VVAGTLLLLAGVVGKSAQFPLHVWLPDAMAGPTPISALIHAATMVAAGVYVVARLYPDFLAAPATMTVLAVIACITMLGAALVALAEDDLKRVLAWSTVSQLAYMLGGLSVGGWTAGVYHLLTHAAFKALLFLAAGSVLRTVGTNLMSEMGGLWRRMPITFVTALVGAAALAGIPPFSGAFSKDAVLAAARQHGGGTGTAVYVVGLVTAFVTAAYVTRMVVRTFLGDYRGRAQLHESPLVMTVPLVVLATFVLALGAPALPRAIGVSRWLGAPPQGAQPLDVSVGGVLVTAVISLAGITLMLLLQRRDPRRDPIDALGRGAVPLRRAFYIDEAYDVAFVRPTVGLARSIARIDRVAVDGFVVGTGRGAGVAGGLLRRLQGGNVQGYLSGLVIGVLIIVVSVSVAVAA